MVGIVVVSHSHALARAEVTLAAEMLHGRPVRIEIAAGLDETTLGTDATAIASAVTEADSGDGVVVLMDLGSAVLSAELALELLDHADRVVLCPAPLVEGLVAAAVAAGSGASREEVAVEAVGGLSGKQAQLGTLALSTGLAGSPGTGISAKFTIANPHGLHTRPAVRLVTLARTYDADVHLRNLSTGSPWAPASSLSRVATLGALQGHEIEVQASGPQEVEAVDQMVALAARAFDEPLSPAAATSPLIMELAPPERTNARPNPMINRDPLWARMRNGSGSLMRSNWSAASCGRSAPARQATITQRSSTPTCSCSTTPTCWATCDLESTRAYPLPKHGRPQPAGSPPSSTRCRTRT